MYICCIKRFLYINLSAYIWKLKLINFIKRTKLVDGYLNYLEMPDMKIEILILPKEFIRV